MAATESGKSVEQRKRQAWQSAEAIQDLDAAEWRNDEHGFLIRFSEYGKSQSVHGWAIDDQRAVHCSMVEERSRVRHPAPATVPARKPAASGPGRASAKEAIAAVEDGETDPADPAGLPAAAEGPAALGSALSRLSRPEQPCRPARPMPEARPMPKAVRHSGGSRSFGGALARIVGRPGR